LTQEVRLVVAGSAGERVQSAAGLFCQVMLAAGLYSTQKRDNPVTQGTGFSLAEICLSPRPIDYTGMESPDAVIVVSEEGWQELRASGVFSRCRPETLLLIDADLAPPPAQGRLWRLPLRRVATGKGAALAGLATWLADAAILPTEIAESALAPLAESRRTEFRQALEVGRRLASSRPEESQANSDPTLGQGQPG
jgi:Pyruvate/2-oxoacid:ferredoxin oxidoreductase gamma subunit